MLRGPDLHYFKSDFDLAGSNADFAIMKATGGNGYVDTSCDSFVEQAIASNKKWGVYHYFSDGFNDGDPIAEADWFIDNCAGYVRKGILILDWERGGNPDVTDTGKALAFLQRVEERTGGVKAIIYMSLSLIRELDWSAVIAGGYGLWCAAYLDNNTPIPNYEMDPARDPNPNWDGNVNDVLWQFTSTGRLDGYGGNLDCNFFYGTRASWDAYAGTNTPPEPTTTTTTEVVPPTTTTTTTEAPTPPQPDPTTTTTTTEVPQPGTSTTTTTSTTTIPYEPEFPTTWEALVEFFHKIIKWLKGEKK